MEAFHFETLANLCVGLAFAGAVLATLGLITAERIDFELFTRNGARGWLAVPLLAMTAPIIILRDLWPEDEALPPGLVAAGVAVALLWSIASGHLLLRIIGTVQAIGLWL